MGSVRTVGQCHFWLYTFQSAGSVIMTAKLILCKHLLELPYTTANAVSWKKMEKKGSTIYEATHTNSYLLWTTCPYLQVVVLPNWISASQSNGTVLSNCNSANPSQITLLLISSLGPSMAILNISHRCLVRSLPFTGTGRYPDWFVYYPE